MLVEELPGGELCILPAEKLGEQIAPPETARILAEHDAGRYLGLPCRRTTSSSSTSRAHLHRSERIRTEATDPELAAWIIGLSSPLTPEQLADTVRPRLVPALSG
jgi:hypothetical protein